ncbi:MAG: flippase-like domain-containing protein [Deltaproteobacteria bacterium]|nr:flippase-like domain-containing protein [Deltaproteobacteria bacterium]
MTKKSYWIGLGISLLFLFLFLRKMDWPEVGRILRGVELIYILPMLLANFLTILIRAERWRYILRPIKKIPLAELYKVTAIGFMANYLLPARVGELLRAFLLGSRLRISKTASLATIVVEKVFDGFTIMLLLVVVLLFMPFPQDRSTIFNRANIQLAGLASFLFYLAVLATLLLMRFHNEPINRLFGFLLKPFPARLAVKVREKLDAFALGLDMLKSPWDLAMTTFYSFLVWGITLLILYFLFFPFQIKLSLFSALFLMVAIVFGIAIPSAPGFIGTFHWVCAAALIFLGVEENRAKSYAVIVWFISFIPITSLGLFILWKEGLSLKGLGQDKTDPPASPQT